jgi:eukaryotic-like serine/threonine-protein kinase
MAIETADEFAQAVRTLGILDSAAQVEFDLNATVHNQAGSLRQESVRREWLTDWQAEMIQKGRGSDLLLGSYLLLDKLGEGGMGVVYKARHRVLNRIVAVKVIRTDRLANPDVVRRFQREIQAAAQLSHPNVVLAYDADQVGDRTFFAMEYIEGVDLSTLVREQGPLPIAEACDCAWQAAMGLQHAHERGLVHRDIKPTNLLLSTTRDEAVKAALSGVISTQALDAAGNLAPPQGVIKILDLGLARITEAAPGKEPSHLTQDGLVVGTPDYLAPEQARNASKVDIRSDVYGLGCTLFFILTGEVPYPSGTTIEKVLRHANEPVPSLLARRPDAPAALESVLARAMAKKPDNRYQTPAEFADALLPFTSDSSVARRTGSSQSHQALPKSSEAETPSESQRLTFSDPVPSGSRRASTDDRRTLIWFALLIAGIVFLGLIGLLTAVMALGG